VFWGWYLDAVPLDDRVVFEDALQLQRAFMLLDGLKCRPATHRVVDECERLGFCHCCVCLPKAIHGQEVALGHKDHDDLRAVDVVFERINGLKILCSDAETM
jgi:hypothetical protein